LTTYRLFPSTSGPSTPVAYSGNFIAGVVIAVKGGGNWFNGYYQWVCPSGQSTSPVKCALWSVTYAANGHVVPGSVVTSGTLTAGQWNFIPLPTPVQLAPSLDSNASFNGSAYIPAIGLNGAFPDTFSQFNSGDLYAAGITAGPLFAYSGTTGSKIAPYSLHQGVFSTAGTDPALVMPVTPDGSGDGGSNLWVDAQISDTAPAGYSGSYRLWPNKSDANSNTSGDAAFNYTVGDEVHLAQTCTLNYAWYFVPAAATTKATRADVWNLSGTIVASITSPSWLNADGTPFANGTAGTGELGVWAKTAFAGGTTLPAGSYRVTVFNANGTSDANWNPKDSVTDYWAQTFTGAGSGGITNGPISAPDWPHAASGYVYGGSASDTPPFSTGGTTIAHAQPPFGQNGGGTVQNPVLYAAVGAGTNQSQVYWTDLEVTPLGTNAPAGLATGAGAARQPSVSTSGGTGMGAALTAQSFPPAGAAVVYTTSGSATPLATTANTAPTGSGLGLLVKNGGGSPVTVNMTIPSAITLDGIVQTTPLTISVAAGADEVIPLRPQRYADPTIGGLATFGLSSVTSVSVACINTN